MKILSIDGGGIRGILPARVLAEIESRTGKRIVDLFDFIAGTSTGGLLAALLLTGKYSAKQCIDLYQENAKFIFHPMIFDVDGILGPKYSPVGIEHVLEHYFGDMKVRDLLKPCLIPCYDTVNRCAKFFAQTDEDDTLVRDACRATSAAPTYFPAFGNYIDGGVFANSPSMCALSEVGTIENVFLLSLGTGQKERSYQAAGWGELSWIHPLIDILLSAGEEVADYHCQKLLGQNYMRVQFDLEGVNEGMDCVSDENIQDLLNKKLDYNIEAILQAVAN